MGKRIVVKIGSNVLTRDNGKLDVTRISSIVDQTVWLRLQGYEVILVSSGSVAGGRGELSPGRRLDSVQQRQLYSAVGQVRLIHTYYGFFRDHGISVGQILTMKENFSSRRAYLNQRSCMEVMLANGVIPIVNENDTVSVTELMFTDNDELSGLIASMMDADTLVILSNVDGVYRDVDDGAAAGGDDVAVLPVRREVIRTVSPSDDISGYISREKSGFGRGGMTAKCAIARKAAAEGIRVIIANGRRAGILTDIFGGAGDVPFTEFVPAAGEVSNVKKWIAHSGSFAKGVIHVNAKAAGALRGERAVSLLMVGVTAVDGDFEEGDIVTIVDDRGDDVAIGRSAYGKTEAVSLIGCHDVRPIVHYDYMYMTSHDANNV